MCIFNTQTFFSSIRQKDAITTRRPINQTHTGKWTSGHSAGYKTSFLPNFWGFSLNPIRGAAHADHTRRETGPCPHITLLSVCGLCSRPLK